MNDSDMNTLISALVEGDQTLAVEEAQKLKNSGVKIESIITDGVETAMMQLDAKCIVEQFNLLEIMLSGRAVMSVIKMLYPVEDDMPRTKGAVVIGSMEGDVHDLGKNIVKMVLTATGYHIVDLGKDCPIDRFLDAAENSEVIAVGVSGLITTVIPQVRSIKARMSERNLSDVKIIAGGAALKQSTKESLQVDYIAKSVFDGLHYLESILDKKKTEETGR